MNIEQLDHVALHVTDIDASKAFYADVLELRELPRPNFDFPGAWFAIGGHELHLIGDCDTPVHSHHRGTHFAVRVSDIEEVVDYLETRNVEHLRKFRPDGAKQVYVQDPDGHFIEFCQPAC